jgi:hypothetical protein
MDFQVLRRTWSTTAAGAGISPKVRADQLGRGVDVDINDTQVPLEQKMSAVKAVRRLLGYRHGSIRRVLEGEKFAMPVND